MARRKKSYKASSKCPEPINTFINLAAGLTMGLIAAHQEKKYHFKEKGKINPYTATAIGFATGSIKSHRDILRTGAILGAMGSFDVEADDRYESQTYTSENPVFNQIREVSSNNNRYAWRLNCEDGSQYDISPYDFETRNAYNDALMHAKSMNDTKFINYQKENSIIFEPKTDDCTYVYLKLSRLDNGINEYYLADSETYQIGQVVNLTTDRGAVVGVVLSINVFTKENAPQPPEETPHIV